MPRFTYTAIGPKGRGVRGSIAAENPYAARKLLRTRGIHPTSLKEQSGSDEATRSLLSMFKRTPRGQIIDFTKQLSTLLNAEIKLTDALAVLTQQINDVKLRNAVSDIRDRVVTGESFADAIDEYTDLFDVIFISMVRIGEATGTLGKSLEQVAEFMEKRQKVETKIVTVMVYPIILVVVCLSAVIFLTVKVIPQITNELVKLGQELPFITRAMMFFSDVLIGWWWLMLGVIVGVVWLFKRFFATERGAWIRDKTLLSLPLFGPLVKQRVVSRFTATLSTLLGSGLSMAESLRVVAKVTGNSVMNRAVAQAKDRIMSGADIATPLRESGVIDPAIAHMISVGERSGELETMLKKVSESLESSSDVVIERLSAAVEPVIIILMAGVVGMIAYAMVMPILQFSSGNI